MNHIFKISSIATVGLLSAAAQAVIGNFGFYPSGAIHCHMSAIKAHSLKLKRGPLLVGDANTVFTRIHGDGEETGMPRAPFMSGLLSSATWDWETGGNAFRARGPKGTFRVLISIPSRPGQRNIEQVDALVRATNRQAGRPEPVGLQTDSCIIYYEDLVELAITHPAFVVREN